MPLRLKALHEARLILGAKEHGWNRGPTVDKIVKANHGYPGEAWCGDTMAYVYRRAGSKCVQRAWASAWNLGWLSGMGRVFRPRPGDIVVYKWHHTGMFVKDLGNGEIETIEGNTFIPGTNQQGVAKKVRYKSQVLRYVRVYR